MQNKQQDDEGCGGYGITSNCGLRKTKETLFLEKYIHVEYVGWQTSTLFFSTNEVIRGGLLEHTKELLDFSKVWFTFSSSLWKWIRRTKNILFEICIIIKIVTFIDLMINNSFRWRDRVIILIDIELIMGCIEFIL